MPLNAPANSPGTGPVKIDAYRRNLQRTYVETLGNRINGRQAAVDDARAFFRGELKTLDTDLRAAAAAMELGKSNQKRYSNYVPYTDW